MSLPYCWDVSMVQCVISKELGVETVFSSVVTLVLKITLTCG